MAARYRPGTRPDMLMCRPSSAGRAEKPRNAISSSTSASSAPMDAGPAQEKTVSSSTSACTGGAHGVPVCSIWKMKLGAHGRKRTIAASIA